MRISVDAGKFACKGLGVDTRGELTRFYLRNKVEVLQEDVLNLDSNDYIIELDGVKYRVGNDATEIDLNVSKKSINHKLLIYIAIVKLMGNDSDIDLMIGCPMSTYVNKDKKDELINYLKGEVAIKVNGVSYSFNIKSVNVLPESLGIPYKDTIKNKKRLIGVLDIGGLNVNGAIYDRLKPIKQSSFTINQGGLILQGKIKRALNNMFEVNFQDYEIPYIIANGVYINGERSIEGDNLVKSVLKSHLKLILDECKRYNWNIGGIELNFTGGCSLDLKNFIDSEIKNAIVSGSSVWDNVIAFNTIGEVLKIG